MTRDNSFKSTRIILNQLIKNTRLEESLFEQQIFDSWIKIVGKNLANICYPVEISGATLVLKAKNQLWRQELGNKHKELLNSIKTKTNVNKISRIEFI